eukprot:gene3289-4120_t
MNLTKNNNFQLNNGELMPGVGLGTFNNLVPGQVGDAVKHSLKTGYRHIDCSPIYGNEKEIGKALTEVFAEGNIKRNEVFIVSKLWNTGHSKSQVKIHCEATLKALGLNYLDLYLIHWPIATEYDPTDIYKSVRDSDGHVKLAPIPIRETWEEMEKLVESGLVKSIGVSNFNVQLLIDLLSYAKIKPVVNQIEMHPYLSQVQLRKFCTKNNILITSYSPLRNTVNNPNDKIITDIAKSHGKTEANVILRWVIQSGMSVIPKSVNFSRIEENFNVFDFQLSDQEMQSIDTLNSNSRTGQPIKFFNTPIFD